MCISHNPEPQGLFDGLPRLDPEQDEYSTRDVAQVLGMNEARVRYHARKRFPNRGGWYRLDLAEATRLLKYIWRVRYAERQHAQIVALTHHLQARSRETN